MAEVQDAWSPGLPRNPEEETRGLRVIMALQPYSLKQMAELSTVTKQPQLLAQLPSITAMATLAAHSPLNAIVQELGDHSATLWRSDWERYTASRELDPVSGSEIPLYISRAITVPADGYPVSFAATRCGTAKDIQEVQQLFKDKKALAGLVLPYQYLVFRFQCHTPDPTKKMRPMDHRRQEDITDILPDFACSVWDCVGAKHRHAFLQNIADRKPHCYDHCAPLVRGWLARDPSRMNGVNKKNAKLINQIQEYEFAEVARKTFASEEPMDADKKREYKNNRSRFDPRYRQAIQHVADLLRAETPTEMKLETLPKEWPRELEIENPRFARGVHKIYLGLRYYEVGADTGQAPLHGLQCAIASVRFVIAEPLYQTLYNDAGSA